jgi:hypothetical protein
VEHPLFHLKHYYVQQTANSKFPYFINIYKDTKNIFHVGEKTIMRFQGYRIPEGQIRDMNYIRSETGMSKSAMVRQGLSIVINEYFQKEKVKQEQIQQHQRRATTMHGGDENFMTLPDGW